MPAKAVFSRLTLAKKKFKDDVGTSVVEDAASNSEATPTKKRPAASSTSKSPKKAKVLIKKEAGLNDHDQDPLADVQATTPPKTPTLTSKPATPAPNGKSRSESQGTSSSKRSSARKVGKVDYSRINDPFMSMEGATNADGENVFGSEHSDTIEDSADSDIDVVEAGLVDIKAEEDEADEEADEV